jgi:TolB-like protein
MAARTEIPPSEGRRDAEGGDAAHSFPVEPSGAGERSGSMVPQKPTGLSSWFAELKRRRVFRALVAYGIAAFAVLQIIEPIMHGAHWPEMVLSYVVAGLAAGFPIVITLAWVFDVKAGRIERTAPAAAAGLRGIRLALLLVGIGVLSAAPGLVWYFLFRSDTRIVARKDSEPAGVAEGKSIAVLPFVNMSGEKENEYFSDGITEELINALSNIDRLRVASRTSVYALKSRNLDAREIGERLKVATLLEGSVRREGSALRVTAQLVRVSDDVHIWSKSYNRQLTGIFALEDEIAHSIAQMLRTKLAGGDSRPLVKLSTSNLEAHDFYLQGRYFIEKRTSEALHTAAEAFQKAIENDPAYALAWSAWRTRPRC